MEEHAKLATIPPTKRHATAGLNLRRKRRKSDSQRKRQAKLDLASAFSQPKLNSSLRDGSEGLNRPTDKSIKKRTYMGETLRPIVCLTFVLPLLLIYELGSIFANQMSGKSGIDQWLHWFMDHVGIGHLVILPLVTAGILLYRHHETRDQWNIHPRVLLGMFAESACLGIILFFAGNAVCQMISADENLSAMAIQGSASGNRWSETIAYIGCGVYEELVFRLILLSGLIHAGKGFLPEMETKTVAMVLTSLIFAALHYDMFNPAGAAFDFYEFAFRFSASIVFCLLFLFRGFGIAVGTHVFYDVMTQI